MVVVVRDPRWWQKGGVQSGLDQEDGDPEESKEGYWSLEGSRGGDCSRRCCGGGGYGGQGSVDNASQRSNRSKWLAKEESGELAIVRSPSSR